MVQGHWGGGAERFGARPLTFPVPQPVTPTLRATQLRPRSCLSALALSVAASGDLGNATRYADRFIEIFGIFPSGDLAVELRTCMQAVFDSPRIIGPHGAGVFGAENVAYRATQLIDAAVQTMPLADATIAHARWVQRGFESFGQAQAEDPTGGMTELLGYETDLVSAPSTPEVCEPAVKRSRSSVAENEVEASDASSESSLRLLAASADPEQNEKQDEEEEFAKDGTLPDP